MSEEQWLSRGEAVELVHSREPMSPGRAEEIASRACSSREVSRHPFMNDGVVGMDLRPGSLSLFSKDDLIDWLDRYLPQAPVQAQAGGKKESGALASKKQIRAIVTNYAKSLNGATPSIPRLEKFARATVGMKGHRDELRAEYNKQFANPPVGRRPKK